MRTEVRSSAAKPKILFIGLLPVQNRSAALRIAAVGCELLGLRPPALEAAPVYSPSSWVA